MAATADIVKRYFAAIAEQDLEAAVACWRPGAIDRFVGAAATASLRMAIRDYFAGTVRRVP